MVTLFFFTAHTLSKDFRPSRKQMTLYRFLYTCILASLTQKIFFLQARMIISAVGESVFVLLIELEQWIGHSWS